MKKRVGAAALAGIFAIAAGVWLLGRVREPVAGPAQNTRPWNATHEKIFLTEQLRGNPAHTPILLRLAQIERSEGDLRGAREHLERAVAADGKQVDARLELGLVCSEMGDVAGAEDQNRAVLRIDPGQPDALYNLGAIAANRGDFQQARKLWSDAVRAGNTESAARARQAMAQLEALK
jgi:Flp pilus assembly protein TadD